MPTVPFPVGSFVTVPVTYDDHRVHKWPARVVGIVNASSKRSFYKLQYMHRKRDSSCHDREVTFADAETTMETASYGESVLFLTQHDMHRRAATEKGLRWARPELVQDLVDAHCEYVREINAERKCEREILENVRDSVREKTMQAESPSALLEAYESTFREYEGVELHMYKHRAECTDEHCEYPLCKEYTEYQVLDYANQAKNNVLKKNFDL